MSLGRRVPNRWRRAAWTLMAVLVALGADGPEASRLEAEEDPAIGINQPIAVSNAGESEPSSSPREAEAPPAPGLPVAVAIAPDDVARTARTVGLFTLISLAPVAVLMLTAFVRISIVLTLLRQALGSPQVPGNQVLTALALMLTVLVMQPVAQDVFSRAIEPYADGQLTLAEAWEAGSTPIKGFMINQIYRTHHEDYLRQLYDYAEPPSPGRVEPETANELPLRIVAPAFLLSELTTALVMGFLIYVPFLVIDLVVSSVLTAMGLFMLPPSLLAVPLKLVVFVLADGWMLVSGALLASFAV